MGYSSSSENLAGVFIFNHITMATGMLNMLQVSHFFSKIYEILLEK